MAKIDVSKALVQNSDGDFLILQKNSSYDWKADKWELPGGKIEDGEDRFEAARRELTDETGLELNDFEDAVRMEIEAEDRVNCFVLFAESSSGKVELSNEHQDYDWISVEDVREIDWHRDAVFNIPLIENLDSYLGI